MIWNYPDRLRQLDAGTLTKTAADTIFQHMGLFQHADANSDVGQRAGPVTNAAGLALK